MTASVVYHMMALDLEPWFFKAVDKLRRSFLWAGQEDARGGCCLVAWAAVCQPKRLGGLGFHNLRWLNTALRARWLWLQRNDEGRPWAGFQFKVLPEALAIFNASTRVTLGDGSRIMLWEDPWITGQTVAALAPAVLKLVPPRFRRRRTVRDGLAGNAWARDIVGELSIDAVVQYLKLWQAISAVEAVGEADDFVWKWTASGQFTSRSAYLAFFEGSTVLPGAPQIWHSFAPLKVRFHAWLALRDRCWTADRRLRRGLTSHTLCPLCSTADETMDHLSVQCPFAIATWAGVCNRLGIQLMATGMQDRLADWWPMAVHDLPAPDQRTANSVIMLVIRSLWLERNARVFDNGPSTLGQVIETIVDEWKMWVSCRRGSLQEVG
ncbi:unnamed protein product [Alopecurus aequalis]